MTYTKELELMLDALEDDGFERDFMTFVDTYLECLDGIERIKQKAVDIDSSKLLMALLEHELTERRDEYQKSLIDV